LTTTISETNLLANTFIITFEIVFSSLYAGIMIDSFMISVIIPTYNEERDISKCLESLRAQSYKNIEIIIVDDGSMDTTLSQIKKFPVKVLTQPHFGPALARNLGASKARGKILVFVDADMTFGKDFVKNLVKPIMGGKTIGTFSKEEYVSNYDNVWSRCWNINKNLSKDKMHPDNYPDTQDVFRAILKSEFDKVGGFDSVGYNDDWTLARKLKTQAVNAPEAIFFHQNPDTLTEVWQQASWIGKRKYKSRFVALIRTSLPISILVGLIKSIYYKNFYFIIFKTIFDLAVFISILKSFLPGYSVVK